MNVYFSTSALRRLVAVAVFISLAFSAFAQRQMDPLGRGMIALHTSSPLTNTTNFPQRFYIIRRP